MKEQDPQARWTKQQNLKPAAVQIMSYTPLQHASWPLSSGSCCILAPHCSWWFWRPVEWVPDSCMTVTSTPLHMHPHDLQQWGLEMNKAGRYAGIFSYSRYLLHPGMDGCRLDAISGYRMRKRLLLNFELTHVWKYYFSVIKMASTSGNEASSETSDKLVAKSSGANFTSHCAQTSPEIRSKE